MGEVEEEGDGHGHKDGDVAGTDVGGFEVVGVLILSASIVVEVSISVELVLW